MLRSVAARKRPNDARIRMNAPLVEQGFAASSSRDYTLSASIGTNAMFKPVVAVVLLAAAPFLVNASECSRAAPAVAAAIAAPAMLAPVAPELVAPSYRLGGHGGVLARAYGEEQSLDQVLQRLRVEACSGLAMAAPQAGVAAVADPAAYIKQTEFDNTPYRFNMTQGGQRMTADDFDAWLQANGYSAGRRVDPNAPVTPALTDVLPVTEVTSEE
ncbi:hypothetical protein ACW7G2_13010 [Luteimonas sp. A277]